MYCETCYHDEHKPGDCAQCNCGEAHIVRGKSTDVYFVPTNVGQGEDDKVVPGHWIDRIPPRRSR